VDRKTDELRAAHDVLAEFYADRLAGALGRMPAERAVLGLFCDLTLAAGLGTDVGDARPQVLTPPARGPRAAIADVHPQCGRNYALSHALT
jgi:hypothetical protein